MNPLNAEAAASKLDLGGPTHRRMGEPFRLRSGTDISDSLSTARLKLKNLKSKKVGVQSQWSITEDGFEQIE